MRLEQDIVKINGKKIFINPFLYLRKFDEKTKVWLREPGQISKSIIHLNRSKFYPDINWEILSLNEKLLKDTTLEDYIDTFYPLVAGQSNDVRVARNISLLATSYKFISEFLWSKAEAIKQQEAFVKMLRDKVRELVVEASDELSSEKFVEVIKELLSSGRARLQQDNGIDIEDSKAPIIGYYGKNSQSMEQVPHLVVGLAFNEVQKYLRSSGESLSHTKKAIISELFENEMVYDAEPVIRKLNSKSVRVIRLKPEYL